MNQKAHLDLLRQANASLIRFLDQASGTPSGTGEEIEALLQVEETLHPVGMMLLDGVLQDTGDSEIQGELARYRESLESLRHVLSLMQASVSACRARLYSRQDHLQAIKAWCTASRET